MREQLNRPLITVFVRPGEPEDDGEDRYHFDVMSEIGVNPSDDSWGEFDEGDAAIALRSMVQYVGLDFQVIGANDACKRFVSDCLNGIPRLTGSNGIGTWVVD